VGDQNPWDGSYHTRPFGVIELEWRKAIIILIISFITLNTILATNIWYRSKPTDNFNLTDTQQDQLETLLKQRNVALKADIPREGRPQAFLEIKLKPINTKRVLESFLGKDAKPEVEYNKDSKSYTYGDKQLIITDNGELTYFDHNDDKIDKTLDKEEARRNAEDFLKNHGMVLEHGVLSGITYDSHSKGYLIEYTRYHDDFFMANSHAAVLVTPSGVKMYYQCWMEPGVYIGKKRSVISPLTAVMRIMTEVKSEAPFTITDIEQGFYSKLYNADRIQAAPIWKIGLDNGDIYYVNAYTGEMEQ